MANQAEYYIYSKRRRLDRIGMGNLVAGKKVVFRLLDDGADEVESLSDGPCLGDLLRGPLGGTPVECPPLVDDVVHGADSLLDRCGGVRAVAQEDVHVLHVEAAQRGAGPLHEVLAGETLVIGAGTAPEELGGDDEIGAAPAELPDGLAHDLLGAAVGVHLGVVEEVDAVVAAALEQGLGLLDVELVAEGDPRPIRELAHLETRSPQVLVLHLALIFFLLRREIRSASSLLRKGALLKKGQKAKYLFMS